MLSVVTMYNEAEHEIEFTVRGLLQNFQEMKEDPRLSFGDEEMYVVVLCDGHDKIPQSFKKFAKDRGFYNEERLIEDGFMRHENGKAKMRRMDEMFDGFANFGVPENFLHLFYVRSDLMLKGDEG